MMQMKPRMTQMRTARLWSAKGKRKLLFGKLFD